MLASRMARAESSFPMSLDHLIVGCNDLDRGVAFLETQLGVRAKFGGVHPNRGTMNALLSLGDRHYLEIMAPDPNAKNLPPPFAAMVVELRKLDTPRLFGWAVHRSDLDTFAQKLRAAGMDIDGPTAGSRVKPDGTTLRWKTLGLKDDSEGLLPFFIEWDASSTHPSKDAPAGCHIESFALAHPDSPTFAQQVKALELDDLCIEKSAAPELRLTLASAKASLRITS